MKTPARVRSIDFGFAAAFFLAAICPPARAVSTLTLQPAAPNAGDRVYATYYNAEICRSTVDTTQTSVRMEANVLILRFEMKAVEEGCMEFGSRFVVQLGQFPAGQYRVDARFSAIAPYLTGVDVSDTAVSTAFEVAAPQRNVPGPTLDHTGIWSSAIEPGWSLLIFQRRDDHLIAGWLTYASDGRPTWYFTVPGRWTHPDVYEAELFATNGGPYFGSSSATQLPSVRKVGSMKFDLVNGGVPQGDNIVRSGAIVYSVDGVSNTRLIRHTSN